MEYYTLTITLGLLVKGRLLVLPAGTPHTNCCSAALLRIEISVKKTSRATRKGVQPAKRSLRAHPRAEQSKTDTFPVVGIGASAGGLEAFKELLTNLHAEAGMAYVLVPHLDPGHQSVLKEILSRFTKIPVAEVMDGMPVERNRIFVLPPNKTMGIAGGKFVLFERDIAQSPHLPIDYFLTALANDWGAQAIGIILSGTAKMIPMA